MSNTSVQSIALPIRQGETAPADLISISDAKNALAALVERVLQQHERVVITRHGRPAVVLQSIEDYTRMAEAITDPIRELEQRFEGLVAAIRSPATRAAGDALFRAPPAALGAAAHVGALKERAQRG